MTLPTAIFVVDKEMNVLFERRNHMGKDIFKQLLYLVANENSVTKNSVVPDSNFVQTDLIKLNQRAYFFSLTCAKLYITYNKGACLVAEQEFISNFFNFLSGLKITIDFYKNEFVNSVKLVNFITVMDEVFSSELTVIPTLDEIKKIMNLYSVNEMLEKVQEEEKMKAMSAQFKQFSLLKEMMEGENTVAPNSSESYRIKRKENKKREMERKRMKEQAKLEKGHAIENEEIESEEETPVQSIGLKLQ